MAHSHVFRFFSSYPYFTLNEDAPPTREFLRLKRLNRWEDGDEEYTEARERFADALAEDFNATYGTDTNNIDHWHTLCRVLRIDPVPEDISACRKVCIIEQNESHIQIAHSFVSAQAVKSRHINLVDLVYHADRVQTFPSIRALAKYSIRRKKIFPKESAKAGGILRYLLRPISRGGL
jgi:hypothetical protein